MKNAFETHISKLQEDNLVAQWLPRYLSPTIILLLSDAKSTLVTSYMSSWGSEGARVVIRDG